MNEIANQLVQSLFKKNSLQECNRWELEILAEHYPYFGIAQLLVSGKLKEEDGEAYKKQIQKTSLYFTNPLWLDYILNNTPVSPEDVNNQNEVKSVSAAEIPAEDTAVVDTEPVHTEPLPAAHEIAEPAITDHLPAKTGEPPAEEPIAFGAAIPEVSAPDEFKIAPLQAEPLPDENAPLVFQAFHTVDYFASQGIKLSLEEKPQDRFGQQLKSFTQWLKTIKKSSIAEIAKEAGTGTEQKVITLAEHSIEDREVVTEAMADVWLKQGNRAKAIEVYHKLSLQNPAKSSYFATLIEQLKQH